MKVYNDQQNSRMTEELNERLSLFRKQRAFDVKLFIELKSKMLNQYMENCGLKSCVVAVSGGIDSAVVLGIVARAAKQPGSPIKKIVPVMLPVFNSIGATNQESATSKGQEVARQFGLEPVVIDLSNSLGGLKGTIDGLLSITGEGWATGQLIPYMRTPTLYYITALLSQEGFPAILCGTTNKDEGAYLGYFGKASDGLVDVQLISDLHKSEVFAVGKELGVPESIMSAIPTGDMYDGRVDEEVFGTSYSFVELYLHFLCLNKEEKEQFKTSLSAESKSNFSELASRLEKMHGYNNHKYIGASPAVHLDLYPSSVPGGWKTNVSIRETAQQDKGSASKFVGAFELSTSVDKISSASSTWDIKEDEITASKKTIKILSSALRKDEINALLNDANAQEWVPVATSGYKKDYSPGDEIGSYRVSAYNEKLAAALWRRIAGHIPMIEESTETTIDGKSGEIWKAVGVSPLFRFIKYKEGGSLLPHYDAPYHYNPNKRTMKSVVIYLTENEVGGETRFVKDAKSIHPESNLFLDWNRQAEQNEIESEIKPEIGSVVIFPHRILHDSKKLESGIKIIIRTDIIFERAVVK